MKKIIVLLVIFCVVLIAAVVVDTQSTTQTEFVLNTVSTITADGNCKDVVEKAFSRVSEIEHHMSSHLEDSDLATGTLNLDTTYVIAKGLGYGKITDGAFDITVKPLCDLWDVNGENPKVPSKEEIDSALLLVDYKKVSVDGNKLVMPENMKLELGAIAKGYAADEACRILRENGIDDGIIDLGGNVVALGVKTVGIRNPLSENNGDYFGILKLQDCAVATSGGYERYFEQDGVRYHHIFDPFTGYPAKTDILSASVICEKAIDADCWSTILFSAGLDKANDYISEHKLNAVLLDENGNVYVFGDVDFELSKTSEFNVIK